MIDADGVLLGGVAPAVVAAAVTLAGWFATRRAGAAWLLGVTAGYLVGHWALDSQGIGLTASVTKSLRPHEARDWLPLAVILAAAIEACSLLGKKATGLTWALRIAWCVWLPWRLLVGSVYLPNAKQDITFVTDAWSIQQTAGWLLGVGTILAIAWLALRQSPQQSMPRLRASLVTLATLGATATIALSGSLTTGQLMGVLTAALVGSGIVAAALRLESGPESAAGPLLAAYGGGLVIASFLLVPELPLHSAGMLLLALVAAAGWIGPPECSSVRAQAGVRVAICLTALALVIVPAARDFAASQAADEANPYLNYRQQ